jgi:geranylgeranyl pyrophosphate synthase
VARLVTVLTETGAIAHNEAEIDRLVTEAGKVLSDLPLQSEGHEALVALSHYVAARTF